MSPDPGLILSASATADVAGALRHVKRTSRETRNVTPTAQVGYASSQTVTWPVKVTGAVKTSPPEDVGLYPGTLFIPDAFDATHWAPADCWIRALPGQTLALGANGMGRLIGWRNENTSAGQPIYSLSAAGQSHGSAVACSGCGWLAGLNSSRSLTAFLDDDLGDVTAQMTSDDASTWVATHDTLLICGVEYIPAITRSPGGLPVLTLTSVTGSGGGGDVFTGYFDCCTCCKAFWAFNLQDLCPDQLFASDECSNVIKIGVQCFTVVPGHDCENLAAPFIPRNTWITGVIPSTDLTGQSYKLAVTPGETLTLDYEFTGISDSDGRIAVSFKVAGDCSGVAVGPSATLAGPGPTTFSIGPPTYNAAGNAATCATICIFPNGDISGPLGYRFKFS